MKRGRLRRYIQSVLEQTLKESNSIGASTGNFKHGTGEQYATPRAFKSKKK